jgi:cytoskeletal protein CcmA (bactofilin family)
LARESSSNEEVVTQSVDVDGRCAIDVVLTRQRLQITLKQNIKNQTYSDQVNIERRANGAP